MASSLKQEHHSLKKAVGRLAEFNDWKLSGDLHRIVCIDGTPMCTALPSHCSGQQS